MIELKNIYKNYGNTNVLRDINIKIERGFYIFLGPSGSGKTTLLNILGHIDSPSSGRRIFKEIDTTNIDESTAVKLRRKYFSYVFQKSNLIEDFYVYENIKIPGLEGNINKEYIKKLGIEAILNKKPHELSTGEKQRVAFLRAITKTSEIIILDEPTANLDEYNTELILSIIKELDKTVIMATHNIDLTRYANYIYKIKNGIIEEV